MLWKATTNQIHGGLEFLITPRLIQFSTFKVLFPKQLLTLVRSCTQPAQLPAAPLCLLCGDERLRAVLTELWVFITIPANRNTAAFVLCSCSSGSDVQSQSLVRSPGRDLGSAWPQLHPEHHPCLWFQCLQCSEKGCRRHLEKQKHPSLLGCLSQLCSKGLTQPL